MGENGRKLNFRCGLHIVICPVTNDQVTISEQQTIKITGDHAAWWACSRCGGWHVLDAATILGLSK